MPVACDSWSVDDYDGGMMSGAGYTMGDAGAPFITYDRQSEADLFQDFRAYGQHWSIATLPARLHASARRWTYFLGDGTRLRDAFLSIGPG